MNNHAGGVDDGLQIRRHPGGQPFLQDRHQDFGGQIGGFANGTGENGLAIFFQHGTNRGLHQGQRCIGQPCQPAHGFIHFGNRPE